MSYYLSASQSPFVRCTILRLASRSVRAAVYHRRCSRRHGFLHCHIPHHGPSENFPHLSTFILQIPGDEDQLPFFLPYPVTGPGEQPNLAVMWIHEYVLSGVLFFGSINGLPEFDMALPM